MERRFDRAAEDVGNIVKLEHVNVRIPDQRLSTLFYVAGLGFTRDPYIMVSTNNMWINMGTSQFHLPTGGTGCAARRERSCRARPRGAARSSGQGEGRARGYEIRLRRAQ